MKRMVALAAGLAFTVAVVTTATAESAAWKPFPALKLFVNDVADSGGGVFWGGGSFLAAPASGGVVYVLLPSDLVVHRIARTDVPFSGGTPTLDATGLTEATRAGALEKDGAVMRWRDGDRTFFLSAKPPLIGAVTLEAILEHKPAYREDAAAYEPDAASVARLRALDKPVEFVVGFGTWCSNCAEWFPRFLRVIGDAKNDRLRVTYLSISEDLKRPAAETAAYKIDGVPTFIARRDGKEIGRVDLDALEAEANPVLEKMLVAIIDRDS